jgi:hypothetical protein
MSLIDHAQHELEIATQDGDLAVEPPIADALLAVVKGFAEQGHSGGSAAIVGPRVGYVLRQLLAYEPITPLTGADDEWMDVAEDMIGRANVQQNIRCGRVFRERTAEDQLGMATWIAYDIEAVVFHDWRGPGAYTGWDSARRVTFPYTPTTRHTHFRRLSCVLARLRGRLRP